MATDADTNTLLAVDPGLSRPGDPNFMASLARGLAVIHTLTGIRHRLTIAQISRRTGLNRAVVRRCLYTLNELGYVAKDGQQYSLQPRVLSFGFASISTAVLTTIAQPILKGLSDELGEASSMGILDGGEIVCVARAAGTHILAKNVTVGSRIPAYCTALGRVLLANAPRDSATWALSRADIVRHTPFTITSRTHLEELLTRVRTDGYAMNDQEFAIGVRSIAVPVRNGAGAVVAAMNLCSGTSGMSRRELISSRLPLLRTAAARVEKRLR